MGLFEMLLIAVVTLLVVGPERMPEAVRSTALTIGRIKRMFNHAKAEVEKQVGAEDIRMQLHNEEIMASLDEVSSSFSSAANTIQSELNDADNLATHAITTSFEEKEKEKK